MLQGQLIGGLVQHAAVEGQVDRVAAVSTGDLLGRPVEVQVNLLGFAQAATFEVVGLWQQGVLVQSQGTLLNQAGDHHRRLEIEVPGTVGVLFQAALGSAAHGQLLPVGGVAGRERLQIGCLQRQREHGESEEQGATHNFS
ncbi:hypothetical protein D3C78_960230 [compost metagenome]